MAAEADPVLDVTDRAPRLTAGPDPRQNEDHYPMTGRNVGKDVRDRSQIAARGSAYVVSLPRVPGAPRVRAGPSHRHARRAAGDRGPWVSLPLRATIPEGNTVGQHADVDVGPSHRAPGLRAPGLIRAEMGTITP